MDKKNITPKQIFRTLAFHYHYDEKIPLQFLCGITSNMYYPRDPTGQAKKRYKNLLILLMKQFTNNQQYINENQFCLYMNKMEKLKKQQFSHKITERIFNRFAQMDNERHQKVIKLQQFKKIAETLQIHPNQVEEYFKKISDRRNLIDFTIFHHYMNSLLPQQEVPQKSK